MPTVTFAIAIDNDDGTGYRGGGAVWANIGTATFTAEETTNLVASKTLFGGNYYVDNAYMRFDTSSIPDGAVITSARLILYIDSNNTFDDDGLSFAADFYDFGGEPSVAGDWEQTSSGDAISSFTTASLTTNAVNNLNLTGLSGINKTGYTGVRIAPVNTTAPTGLNSIEIAAFEAAQQEPRLEVTYTTTAWVHEQSNGLATAGPIAFTNDVKAGSLLIAIHEDDATPPQTTPTDSRGNTWNLIGEKISSQAVHWWYAVSKDAGPCTVTFSAPAGFNGVKVSEWSRLDSATPALDAHIEGALITSDSTATDAYTSGSMTASQDDALVLGVLATEEGIATVAVAGTGFTMRETTGIFGSANDKFLYESMSLASAGSVAATFTETSLPQNSFVVAAVFKTAAAPGFVFPHRIL